jgi:predicted nucleic acid-binding Zn ribbon protein
MGRCEKCGGWVCDECGASMDVVSAEPLADAPVYRREYECQQCGWQQATVEVPERALAT